MSSRIADLEEAIRLDPASAWGYLYLSRALHHAGRIDEAVGFARRGAALEPSFSLCHWTVGGLLMAVERWSEAAEALARACELGEPSGCALRPLAVLRGGSEDGARAAADAAAGMAMPPPYRYHLARYLALAGERDPGLEVLRSLPEWVLDRPRFLQEQEFAALRGDPDFDAMVAEVRTRADAR
jgi:tetratricopeptide (TPR) repeat protein